jgi:hypothetical protein
MAHARNNEDVLKRYRTRASATNKGPAKKHISKKIKNLFLFNTALYAPRKKSGIVKSKNIPCFPVEW